MFWYVCTCEGGLSFEVREFFRETTSSQAAAMDDMTAESPASRRHDDVTSRRCHVSAEQSRSVNTRHPTSSTSCRRDVTPSRTTATAADAGSHDAVDNDETVRYKQSSSSSSSSPAPSTWIAFKVCHSRISPTFIYFSTLSSVLHTFLWHCCTVVLYGSCICSLLCQVIQNNLGVARIFSGMHFVSQKKLTILLLISCKNYNYPSLCH